MLVAEDELLVPYVERVEEDELSLLMAATRGDRHWRKCF
jgi:hypothetical protein